jgi:hypothetical protein
VESELSPSEKLAFWETTGSVLWFLMDACWMFEAGLLAQLLILPAVLPHLAAVRCVSQLRERLVAGAIFSWLAMNVAWMVADIHDIQPLYWVAKGFTVLGFALLVFALFAGRKVGESWHASLRRFRRMRIS